MTTAVVRVKGHSFVKGCGLVCGVLDSWDSRFDSWEKLVFYTLPSSLFNLCMPMHAYALTCSCYHLLPLSLFTTTRYVFLHGRRKLATVLQEIQQYQNTPYCIEPESSIQKFLVNQDPMGDLTPQKWEEDLFEQSRVIEPKDQPPKKAVSIHTKCANVYCIYTGPVVKLAN